MILLLSVVTVVTWGSWIPLAQAVGGVSQGTRTLYAALGNLGCAAVALLVGGDGLDLGWHDFWLPLAGGLVWVAGNYSAFRATELIGLARAAGSWTPLNIVVAFCWGAALFGELDGFSSARFAVLGCSLVLVLAGVLLIVTAQDTPAAAGEAGEAGAGTRRRVPDATGLLWAGAAGVLWGSYFVPAQWAGVPAQVGNAPLALGIMAGATLLALRSGGISRLRPAVAAVQLGAGLLFGIGNLALLSLVSRVGSGVGFTIAQLSLLVNASIGIAYFRVPPPGSRSARIAIAGIVIAGVGGAAIGAMR